MLPSKKSSFDNIGCNNLKVDSTDITIELCDQLYKNITEHTDCADLNGHSLTTSPTSTGQRVSLVFGWISLILLIEFFTNYYRVDLKSQQF